MNRAKESTPPATMVNIADHLSRMARRYPSKHAVVCPAGRDAAGDVAYSHLTFSQLDHQSDRYARGLERIGVGRGMRTILMVRPGPDFFALTFALFRVGAAPVMIDPGIGRHKLAECLARVEAEAFIGVPLAHVLRILHPQAFRTVKITVTVGRRYVWGGCRLQELATEPWQPCETALTRADDVAAILFTSGSTGPPKGVVYTHGMIDAQVRSLQSHFGYAPDEIDLATFPLFALFDAAVGMTAVIPDMDPTRPGSADPRKIIEAIDTHGCTHMFGSPALLDRVGRYGEAHGVTLPSLKRVVTAGAPVRPEILERFAGLLAGDAVIHTPYGATEALPIASISSDEILTETKHQTARGGGTCVGRPLRGVDVRIIEITDEPIAEWQDAREIPVGEIGEIVVRGPVVAREYFRQPEATALAKIRDRDGIWHRMGDVGYLDGRGRLWFCGRKAHRVTTERRTLFTIPCEAIFNQHPRVRRTALVGVGAPGQQRAVLCVEFERGDDGADRDRLTRELLSLGDASDLTKEIKTVLYHPGFPVDVRHNAKIFREKLAAWAAERLQ
jgi:acyl-CoA synthetase (AMP-forming)/AMP-acid ligase II